MLVRKSFWHLLQLLKELQQQFFVVFDDCEHSGRRFPKLSRIDYVQSLEHPFYLF